MPEQWLSLVYLVQGFYVHFKVKRVPLAQEDYPLWFTTQMNWLLTETHITNIFLSDYLLERRIVGRCKHLSNTSVAMQFWVAFCGVQWAGGLDFSWFTVSVAGFKVSYIAVY